MKFDNFRTIISIRIKLFVATVLFLAYIGLTYAANMIKYPLLGMNEKTWTIILVCTYFFILLLPLILNYQFISYSDEEEKIVFRYFSAGIVGGKKNSVEISKRSFTGYKIVRKLFGLKQSIILFQQFKEGVAEYPPIYISALKRDQKSKLVKSLNLYITKV